MSSRGSVQFSFTRRLALPLEKGVGGSNEVPGQAGEGSGMSMGDDAAKDDSNGPDEAGGVEGVRRQMEGLKAKEGSSQAG